MSHKINCKFIFRFFMIWWHAVLHTSTRGGRICVGEADEREIRDCQAGQPKDEGVEECEAAADQKRQESGAHRVPAT